MNIQKIMAYGESARLLLYETLDAHPEARDTAFETISRYQTITALVVHMVGAEQRWTLGRLYAEPVPVRYEEQAAPDWDGLKADWEAVRARTLAFVGAESTDWGRIIPVDLPQWNQKLALTTEEVILQLCNHQTWHIGQISMALQRLGIDPPNFDYVLLKPS